MFMTYITNNQEALIRFFSMLIFGFIAIKLVIRLMNRSKLHEKMDKTIRYFIMGIIRFLLYASYIIALMTTLGVPMTSFIAMFSALGLAIALALQGNLSNFASALVILYFKPFVVGDFIESQAHMGTVKEIQLLFTHLLTPDNRRIIVPNSELVNGRVINYSAESTRRIELVYSASYAHTSDEIIRLLRGIANSNPVILTEPEPLIRMKGHGDSALQYDVKIWVKKEDYWPTLYWFNEETRRVFEANGVKAPYPRQEVIYTNIGGPKTQAEE